MAVAPAEIPTPRWVAVLAAGNACRTRHAAARSGSSRSAHHGGGPSPGRGSTPRATSADEIACAAADVSTATVRPACCNSDTARARASSMEPFSSGLISSNAGRISPSESASTETSSAPVRCASPTTADANGSWAARKSASTSAAGPLADIPGTRCQPGRWPLFSSTSWARFHATDRSPSAAPRMRATRKVLVHKTLGSMTIASIRSRRRSASGRKDRTAC